MRSTVREANFRRTFGPIQRELDVRLSEPKRVHRPPPVEAYFDHKFDSNRVTRICESNCHKKHASINEQCTHTYGGKFYWFVNIYILEFFKSKQFQSMM